MRISAGGLSGLATVATLSLALTLPAAAMDGNIATECSTCEFAASVSVAAQCSGVYMGHGMILTAAHCANVVREGVSQVFFGEDIGAPVASAVIERCVRYPNGNFAHNALGQNNYDGVDLAFCMLDDSKPLPDIPVVPPMIPTGCERDWLAQRVHGSSSRAPVTAVGFGCAVQNENGMLCDPGVKRRVTVQLAQQISYAGSSTKLELRSTGAQETGIMAGDSGAPYFAALPDGTWRLIAVHHGANASLRGSFAEAVAPYVHWIESASGIDITPCHEFVAGEWVASARCADAVPLRVDAPGRSWTNGCAGVASLVNESCAAWSPHASDTSGAELPNEVFQRASRKVLAAAEEDRASVLDEVIAQVQSQAVFPFLASELPGMVPIARLKDEATSEGAEVATAPAR